MRRRLRIKSIRAITRRCGYEGNHGEFERSSVGSRRVRRVRHGVRLTRGADFQRRNASPGGSSEGLQSARHRKGVEVREDGRRTPKSSDYFEWWYFDGLLDDGTAVVVWFGDSWFYGSHKRAVNIQLTPPAKPTRSIMRTFDDPGAFSSDHADCDLTVRRRIASFRRANPCGTTQLRVFAWHNHVISVLRPEAILFGLRCLMIIGTEGGAGVGDPARTAPGRMPAVLPNGGDPAARRKAVSCSNAIGATVQPDRNDHAKVRPCRRLICL
ncbi:MAG: hypothetical protein QOK03_598 [Candidatus Binataceae bacterium]|nr:hypothetical protein [Candidatus Binataceae bacterium]